MYYILRTQMIHIVSSLKKLTVKLRKYIFFKKSTEKAMQNTYNTLFTDTEIVV